MNARRRRVAQVSPADYELAVLEAVRLEFARTPIRVLGTEDKVQHRVAGRHSRVRRQLDVAAYRPGDARPFMIADAKRRGRRIHVPDAEAFIGMMDDVGAEFGLLVAPLGFTSGAERRVVPASGRVRILTVEEALTFRWLPVARGIYPQDWYFHEELALAIRRLNERAPVADVIEALEPLAFEEWDAFMRHALAQHQRAAIRLLEAIAGHHPDDGWRFNAVELLDDRLTPELARQLLASERDSETRELLQDRAGAT